MCRLQPLLIALVVLAFTVPPVSAAKTKRAKRLSQAALKAIAGAIELDEEEAGVHGDRAGVRLPSGLILMLDEETLYAIRKSAKGVKVVQKRTLGWGCTPRPKDPDASCDRGGAQLHVVHGPVAWIVEARVDGLDSRVNEDWEFPSVEIFRLYATGSAVKFVSLHKRNWQRVEEFALCAVPVDSYCQTSYTYGACMDMHETTFQLKSPRTLVVKEVRRKFIKRNPKFNLRKALRAKRRGSRWRSVRQLRRMCPAKRKRVKVTTLKLKAPASPGTP